MGREVILKVENISKSFDKNKILKNISFEVFEGEILGLIGASGSGKTTLLKTISGFLLPESGEVKFRYDCFSGKKKDSVNSLPIFCSIYSKPVLFRTIFGFASQAPSFYEKMTVLENLKYFGSLYDLKSKALNSNISVLLSLMDLSHAKNTLGGKLSGGMERRLDIACGLIHDPEILILDEPTSDLDPVLRNHIWSLVQKINRRGTTIILASHHLSEVEHFCSRIAIIRDGKLVELESVSKLKSKHSSSQEIVLQSYPGRYDNIAKSLKKSGGNVFDVKIKGSELVLFSDNPSAVLHDLLHTLEIMGEELIDVKVSRPSLDDMFLKISEKDHRDKNKELHHSDV
jgi:ABC-2 type transport system ATP-binding protein